MKFKVGEKVKILWGKTLYCSEGYADKGEIVEVMERPFYKYLVRGFSEKCPRYTLIFGEDELILLEEEKQTMKKSDLKQGALVETRNGDQYLLIDDGLVNLKNGGYILLRNLKSDLRAVPFWGIDFPELDVMKVYQGNGPNEGYYQYINKKPIKWTWERKEEEPSKELTVGEIEILLGYKVKIIKEETNE